MHYKSVLRAASIWAAATVTLTHNPAPAHDTHLPLALSDSGLTEIRRHLPPAEVEFSREAQLLIRPSAGRALAELHLDIRTTPNDVSGAYYVNVAVDLDGDGEFADRAESGHREWLARNQHSVVDDDGTATIASALFYLAGHGELPSNVWMRTIVSDAPIDSMHTLPTVGAVFDDSLDWPEDDDGPLPIVTLECPNEVSFREQDTIAFSCTLNNLTGTQSDAVIELNRVSGDVTVGGGNRWLDILPVGDSHEPLLFTASRPAELPAHWTYRAAVLEPFTHITATGVRMHFRDSVGDIVFVDDALQDTTTDGPRDVELDRGTPKSTEQEPPPFKGPGGAGISFPPVLGCDVSEHHLVRINDDDDNENGRLDLTEIGVKSENDLIELVINQKHANHEVEILSIDFKGNGRGLLWADRQKTQRVSFPSLNVSGKATRVYFEGTKVSKQPGDIEIRFVLKGPRVQTCHGVYYVTVYGISDVVILPRTNSEIEQSPFAGPNNAAHWRIFPGFRSPDQDSSQGEDLVTVQAQIVPPLEGIDVYFRSIDVDDPSSASAPVDDESSALDNRDKDLPQGEFPGFPRTANWVVAQAKTTAFGTANVKFRVAQQPGDNFKIVAALDAATRKRLSPVQNDPKNLHIKANGGSAIAQNSRTMLAWQSMSSDVLTVWRKLHVYSATMAAPKFGQNDERTGRIANVVWVAGTSTRKYTVRTGLTFDDDELYAGGLLTTASGSYAVIASDANGTLVVLGPAPGPKIGESFRLWDDDLATVPGTGPLVKGFNRPEFQRHALLGQGQYVDFSFMPTAFAPAYILPIEHRIPGVSLSFKKHADGHFGLRALLKPAFEEKSKRQYWVSNVAACFQGEANSDFDGESSAQYGVNIGYSPYSCIFREVIREVSTRNEGHIVAHEVAHTLCHPDHPGGLMFDSEVSKPVFIAKSIATFRKMRRPYTNAPPVVGGWLLADAECE